ncbi:ABC transporter permease subunit [Kitasatospora sp. NPDC054939]
MSLPPETGRPDTGVIHDIGYRGYTGPRLGRSYATRSLYVQSLRAAYGLGRSGKSKVLPMLVLGVVAIPAVIMVAVTVMTNGKELPLDYPEYLSIFGLFVSIFLAAQAPVLLSRDLRHHTVPLYFSRPITRSDYVRAKFAAMASAQLLLMVVPLVVLYLGALLAGLPFGHNTAHFLFGLVTAVLYALVPTSVALVIAAATPRRGFGVAAIMGYQVITSVVVGIIFGVTAGTGEIPPSADWAALLSPGLLVDGLVNQLFDLTDHSNDVIAPGTAGLVVFAAVAAAMVAGAYRLLLRRYHRI